MATQQTDDCGDKWYQRAAELGKYKGTSYAIGGTIFFIVFIVIAGFAFKAGSLIWGFVLTGFGLIILVYCWTYRSWVNASEPYAAEQGFQLGMRDMSSAAAYGIGTVGSSIEGLVRRR